jgi:hypothetical protein
MQEDLSHKRVRADEEQELRDVCMRIDLDISDGISKTRKKGLKTRKSCPENNNKSSNGLVWNLL